MFIKDRVWAKLQGWKKQKGQPYVHQRSSLGQVARMEGTTSLSSGEGGTVKGGSAGHSNLRHELFQTPHHAVQ